MDAKRHLRLRAEHFDLLRHLLREEGRGLPRAELRLYLDALASGRAEPAAVLEKLVDEGILVEEEGGDLSLHPQVERDSRWLLQHQRVESPKLLQARIEALRESVGDLMASAREMKVELATDACEECDQRLREMADWSANTRRAVLGDVLSMKARDDRRTAQQRLQAILHLHDRFVEPLRQIVRPQGDLPMALLELEAALRMVVQAFGVDPSVGHRLDRVRNRSAALGLQAFEDFLSASTAVLPLYQQARRDSAITQAVAHCLDTLSRDGIEAINVEAFLASPTFRVDGLFGLPDLNLVLNALRKKAEAPPPIRIPPSRPVSQPTLPRRSTQAELAAAAPIPDLLGWLFDRYAVYPEDDVLRLYSDLLDHKEIERGDFGPTPKERVVGHVVYRYHPVEVVRVCV